MKKSKLLIPAIAFLVVSMAAAATSTVAWFTANTQVSASVSNIIAASSDGSLFIDEAYNMADGINKTSDLAFAADYSTLTAAAADIPLKALRDGSVNVTDETKYYRNKDAQTGALLDSYTATTVAKDPSSAYYFYAKFQLKFVVKTSDSAQKYDVYMDATSALSVPTSYTSKHIDSAVRIGMITGTKKNVWAPHYDTTDTFGGGADKNGANIKYVDSATSKPSTLASTYSYTATAGTSDAYSTAANIAAYDSTPTYSTQSNYLGRISTYDASGYGTLTTTFYIWFEGEDLFCDNTQIQATADAFSLSMKFNTVKGV